MNKIWLLGYDTPKFCKRCGQELKYTSEPIEYDAVTGKPCRYVHNLFCPDIWRGKPHSKYTWMSKKENDL